MQEGKSNRCAELEGSSFVNASLIKLDVSLKLNIFDQLTRLIEKDMVKSLMYYDS